MRKRFNKGNLPIIILICVGAALIIGFSSYVLFPPVTRDGDVYAGWVRIADEKYVYCGFLTEGMRKKIAEIDGWGVYEVKEDPSRTFLMLKEFTSEDYIVKEDYKVPTEGKVNCVYVDRIRFTGKKIRDAFDEIRATEFDEGIPYYLTGDADDPQRWRIIVLGYEDCPVGTDYSIYGISKIGSKWAIIFRDEIGESVDGDRPTVYHELDPKYNEIFDVFENSLLW